MGLWFRSENLRKKRKGRRRREDKAEGDSRASSKKDAHRPTEGELLLEGNLKNGI